MQDRALPGRCTGRVRAGVGASGEDHQAGRREGGLSVNIGAPPADLEAMIPRPISGGRAAPVLFWFRVTAVPSGGAPPEIRCQWVGVPLPVRRPRPVEGPQAHLGRDVVDRRIRRAISDGVVVEPPDALAALRLFDRSEAAAWWQAQLASRPLANGLVFRRHEGEFLPTRLAHMLHPELDDFAYDGD